MLLEEAKKLEISLTQTQIAQFETYERLLLAWNSHTNLTRITEPSAILYDHFLDSLTCLTQIDESVESVIDVGTGAGFPGLVMKIARPELAITVTDSVGKKTAFLEAVINELQLAHVTVLTERAEILGQSERHREKYDIATARAVAPLNILAEYLLPLVKVGGSMLAMKGASTLEETNLAENAFSLLGGGKPLVLQAETFGREAQKFLVQVKKNSPTPAKYPRRVGVARKRPIR